PGLLGAMMGFFGYVAVFHRGRWMKKVAAVLVFYPALIAVNYLMQDAGSNLFFAYTGAPGEPGPGWTESDWFWSTLIHTLSLLARLGFWVGPGPSSAGSSSGSPRASPPPCGGWWTR